MTKGEAIFRIAALEAKLSASMALVESLRLSVAEVEADMARIAEHGREDDKRIAALEATVGRGYHREVSASPAGTSPIRPGARSRMAVRPFGCQV